MTQKPENCPPVFPLGEALASRRFSGKVWVHMLVEHEEIFNCPIAHVTFEPGCRNNWHSHPGGQILLCTGGTGYYQEMGSIKEWLEPGDVVEVPPHMVHWHGATPNSRFSHLSIETNAEAGPVQWFRRVRAAEYGNR